MDITISTPSSDKLVPPPEQEVTGNELEPRREGVFYKRLSQGGIIRSRVLTGVLKHILKLLLAHVLVIPNLVQVRGNVDIGGEEQNVVDWVGRSALAIRERSIVNIPSCSPQVPSEGAR